MLRKLVVYCQECRLELAADSPDLRLEFTCDDELFVDFSVCWEREFVPGRDTFGLHQGEVIDGPLFVAQDASLAPHFGDVICGKELVVADGKTKMAEDLELSQSKAGEVKGGRTPIERDGAVPRGLATHKGKKDTTSSLKPLRGSMAHE